MKLENDIQPVTYLKSHAADLLQQVNDTRRPVVITQNGLWTGGEVGSGQGCGDMTAVRSRVLWSVTARFCRAKK